VIAAVAGGLGYLIADRLLGFLSLPLNVTRRQASDDVACTVFAPSTVAPRETFLVQAFIHFPDRTDDARAVATEMDEAAERRVYHSLEAPVAWGQRLHFELHAPSLIIDDPVATLVWRERTEAVQFGVHVPLEASGTVILTLIVSLDAAPLGHVKFKVAVVGVPTARLLAEPAASVPEPQGQVARRYHAAFISYASKDRDTVLARVQMLSAVGVRYFQDVLDLEPGVRWQRSLELGLDECDLFLLFWSGEAKRSEWVRKEVQYALRRRGGDDLAPPEIMPVIIEGPPVIKPWEELEHLHFDDRVLYFMGR
jgi:hypothetical protein